MEGALRIPPKKRGSGVCGFINSQAENWRQRGIGPKNSLR